MSADNFVSDELESLFVEWAATTDGREALAGLPELPDGRRERERDAAAQKAFHRWATRKIAGARGGHGVLRELSMEWLVLRSSSATL